jgi:hypothetical protein
VTAAENEGRGFPEAVVVAEGDMVVAVSGEDTKGVACTAAAA